MLGPVISPPGPWDLDVSLPERYSRAAGSTGDTVRLIAVILANDVAVNGNCPYRFR